MLEPDSQNNIFDIILFCGMDLSLSWLINFFHVCLFHARVYVKVMMIVVEVEVEDDDIFLVSIVLPED